MTVCSCTCLVCVTHVCTDPVDGVHWNALLAGSMCRWLIPPSLKGAPPPLLPKPPPPSVLLSPSHHHLHRWVLLFPHRILIMAIEEFQRGWFTPFTPPRLNGVMMQEVAEGGKREDPSSKQTTANANKDFLQVGCLSAYFQIHEVLLCSPKHGR